MKANHLKIVGMDPSMLNWGISVGHFNLDSEELIIQELRTLSYKPPKTKLRKNYKDILRANFLYTELSHILHDADIIMAEIPVGSKSARAMASYSMCVTIVGALNILDILIPVTPSDVKLIVGDPEASKDDVMEWAIEAHPEAPWATYIKKGIEYYNKSVIEHQADAIAAMYAGSLTPKFNSLIQSLRK